MDNRDKVIKLGNLVQGHVYYDLRHAIYWPKGCAPALTAAMGMGGGFVPHLVMIGKMDCKRKKGKKCMIVCATINDCKPQYKFGICPTLKSNCHGAIPHFVWIDKTR